MARYPGANTTVSGPWQKTGYGPTLQVNEAHGIVLHDAVGSLGGAFGELRNLNRRASWYATIDLDGKVYEHYASEKITWHCGSLFWNCRLIGIEHVSTYVNGHPSTIPVRGAQLESSTKVVEFLQREHGFPLIRPVTAKEHTEISQTSCPNGRIPWPAYEHEPEDEMGAIEELKKALLIIDAAQAGQIKLLEETQQFLGEIDALLSVGKDAEAEARLRYVYQIAGQPWPA